MLLTDLEYISKNLTHGVTLSSFIRTSQNSLWGLPVFKSKCHDIASHFELIIMLIRRVGLNESGDDSIIVDTDVDHFGKIQAEARNVLHSFQRRQRIVGYCLNSYQNLSKKNPEV